MSIQERIKQALDDLATAPEPANLADRALRAASRRRATTIGAAFGTGAVAVAMVAVGIAGLPRHGGETAPPAQVATSPEPCVTYTTSGDGLPDLQRDQWPDFVAAAVAALPARSDYSLQSGYAWCDLSTSLPETANGWKISSAVVNLGPNREAGVLLIDIFVRVPQQPASCSEVAPPEPLLFCTPGMPVVYAYGHGGAVVVTAVYGGGVEVRMPYDGNALTAQQLATAASDPGVRQIIQDSLSGLPT